MSKYDRPLPGKSLGAAALSGLLVAAALLTAWEMHWRELGNEKSYRNSDGLWVMERRRIDNGEGHKTAVVGSSRTQFGLQLDVWEQLSGERPIQLAMVGTSPLTAMEGLADDLDFTGPLIVGVAPDLFFSGLEFYGGGFTLYNDESPAQWLGQRISLLLEPHLAFYDVDYALIPILRRQPLPPREGVFDPLEVRKLDILSRDRNIRMWQKAEEDAEYLQQAKDIWAQYTPVEVQSEEIFESHLVALDAQIERAEAVTDRLHARGIEVIYVRWPSVGRYQESESVYFPRQQAWDVLIERTGALGIHWEDHAELQGYDLPEWSHLSASEADRFTAALHKVIQRERQKFSE